MSFKAVTFIPSRETLIVGWPVEPIAASIRFPGGVRKKAAREIILVGTAVSSGSCVSCDPLYRNCNVVVVHQQFNRIDDHGGRVSSSVMTVVALEFGSLQTSRV